MEVLRAKEHGPSCARRIRGHASEQGLGFKQTAWEIQRCCGVTALRSFRLARGLTLNEAGAELRTLGSQGDAGGAQAYANQLRLWETPGGRRPRAETISLLCRFYACTPAELGLLEYHEEEERPHPPERSTVQGCTATAQNGLLAHVDAARRSVDRTLAAGSVSAGQMDLLEERMLMARRAYVYTPPAPMLNDLLADLKEVEQLTREQQPTSIQVRLTETTAVLTTLIADALMKLGHTHQAWAWYGTARHAADESGNRDLRARVRVQAAMLPYYFGPLEQAIALAREARVMCRGRPSATAAFAAVAEARALAQHHQVAAADARVREARQLFDQVPAASVQDDAFAFPERRFLLYLSGTYTAMGHGTKARRAQEEALALYPKQTGIDPALLRLEAAICLAHDRSPTEACQLATATYLQIPEDHRTPIIGARARRVLEELPGGTGRAPAVKELKELLELPSGAK
ncbi:XRE family transcriptional regulator [Streptomyces sp. NPDC003077]|uniref:XRE family transcriptional regulator n=1 Tax=Streptomyces sp. NPDC003077 TaxID=3154443 RepID=UPI0033B05043